MHSAEGSEASQELNHLIKMINQIADNIAIGESAEHTANQVVDHIKRFWARPMKEQITAYGASDGVRLNTVARLAVSRLDETTAND